MSPLTYASAPEMLFSLTEQQNQRHFQQQQCQIQAQCAAANVVGVNRADSLASDEAHLFQRVAVLNERGIRWLHNCLYGGDSKSAYGALVLFQAAMRCTRDFLEGQSDSITNNNNDIIRDLLMFEDKESIPFNTWSQLTVVENVIVSPFHLIPSLPSSHSSDPFVNVSISFAVLMFNMGIAYHLQAIMTAFQDQDILGETLPSRESCLKALMVYEKSLDVLEKICLLHPASISHSISFGLQVSGCAAIDLLHMALYNNLAHVAYSTNDYLAAKQYSHQLQSMCCYLKPRVMALYPDDPETQRMVLHCVQYLWHNVREPHCLHIPTVASAA